MVGNVEVIGVGGGTVARATIEAKIIRKDGTVEDLGVIADSGLLLTPPPQPGFLQRVKDKLWPKN